MFDSDLGRHRCSLKRVVHDTDVVPVDMGDDLLAQREKSFFMGFFVFVDMYRGDFKGTIPLCIDLFVGDAFVILLDVDHQHM
jgi:hypothetical protein